MAEVSKNRFLLECLPYTVPYPSLQFLFLLCFYIFFFIQGSSCSWVNNPLCLTLPVMFVGLEKKKIPGFRHSDPYSLKPDPAKNLNPDQSFFLTLPGINIKLFLKNMLMSYEFFS